MPQSLRADAELDWFAFANRLNEAVHRINRRLRYDRNTRRLEALYAELEPMKFRITEPTFFWGKERQPGEIMEAPAGPYRNTVVGGHGLVRVPQFVEISEVTDTPAPVAPPPASFAEATASIVKPAPKPATVSMASQLASLTQRRLKLNTEISSQVTTYTAKLSDLETKVPQVFTKAHARIDDETAHLGDLDKSLSEFDASNGGDPL